MADRATPIMKGSLAVDAQGRLAPMPRDDVSEASSALLDAITLLSAIDASNAQSDESDITGRTGRESRIKALVRMSQEAIGRAMAKMDPYH